MDPTSSMDHQNRRSRPLFGDGVFSLGLVHADAERVLAAVRAWNRDVSNLDLRSGSTTLNVASSSVLGERALQEIIVDPPAHGLYVCAAGDGGEVDGQLCQFLTIPPREKIQFSKRIGAAG